MFSVPQEAAAVSIQSMVRDRMWAVLEVGSGGVDLVDNLCTVMFWIPVLGWQESGWVQGAHSF